MAGSDIQLSRIVSVGADAAFDLLIVAGAGLVGSQAAVLGAPCAERIMIVDDDEVTVTTTVLAPYGRRHLRMPKSRVMARRLERSFSHLRGRCEGLNVDARILGEGFWRAASRLGRALLIGCLDNFESTAAVATMARKAGIPAVIASVGRDSAEVIAIPADPEQACYSCMGLSGDESRPCLGRREAAAPTLATPDIGAVSAGTAVMLARQLSAGMITATQDYRIVLRQDVGVRADAASVQRAAGCPFHREADRPIVESGMDTSHTWAQVAGSLGDPGATLVPGDLPPVTAGAPEGRVPLQDLGIPMWAVVECTTGGERISLELAGDRSRLGLSRLMEGRHDTD